MSSALAQSVPAPSKPDVTLGSRPETVIWGYFSARVPPALRIKSGTTVRIDTMSHQGLLRDDPVAFFGTAGIRPDEVLQDAKDIYTKVPHPKGLGVHVLTGPIFIEGAAPGDMLEVRVVDLEDAANYYTLGLDLDLNTAMKTAVRETVELLQEKAGLTAAEAYAIASMGVDFKVAEAVDSVQLIYGTVPKKFFKEKPAYWGSRLKQP